MNPFRGGAPHRCNWTSLRQIRIILKQRKNHRRIEEKTESIFLVFRVKHMKILKNEALFEGFGPCNSLPVFIHFE